MPDFRPILLVEDNPWDIEMTTAALAKCQPANETVVARNRAEALDPFLGYGPDHKRPLGPAVVLLDLKLPEVNGLEVSWTGQIRPEACSHSRSHVDLLARGA